MVTQGHVPSRDAPLVHAVANGGNRVAQIAIAYADLHHIFARSKVGIERVFSPSHEQVPRDPTTWHARRG